MTAKDALAILIKAEKRSAEDFWQAVERINRLRAQLAWQNWAKEQLRR